MDRALFKERLELCRKHVQRPYHWIEEGTPEDFKRNVLESDVPAASFDFDSTGYFLIGTYTGRIANPCNEIPLLGTHTVPVFWEGVDLAQAEEQVITMLLQRPELILNEPKAIKAGAPD